MKDEYSSWTVFDSPGINGLADLSEETKKYGKKNRKVVFFEELRAVA